MTVHDALRAASGQALPDRSCLLMWVAILLWQQTSSDDDDDDMTHDIDGHPFPVPPRRIGDFLHRILDGIPVLEQYCRQVS